MTFLLDAVASPILKSLLPGLIAGAVGFTAAEVYEHRVPWGLSAQLSGERAALPAKLDQARRGGIAAQVAEDKSAFDQWSAELTKCRTDLSSASTAYVANAHARDHFLNASTAAAYELGRATCGDPHAPSAPDPARVACLVGLPVSGRDVRSLVGQTAYAPGGQTVVPPHR